MRWEFLGQVSRERQQQEEKEKHVDGKPQFHC
jgi:hypothetical protein